MTTTTIMPMKHRRCCSPLQEEKCHQQRRSTVFRCERLLLPVFFSAPSQSSLLLFAAVATDTTTPTLRVVSRRLFFSITIKQQRRCTIRLRIFVTMTQIILRNSAGGTWIVYLPGIGKGRVVMALAIVVNSVPSLRMCRIANSCNLDKTI